MINALATTCYLDADGLPFKFIHRAQPPFKNRKPINKHKAHVEISAIRVFERKKKITKPKMIPLARVVRWPRQDIEVMKRYEICQQFYNGIVVTDHTALKSIKQFRWWMLSAGGPAGHAVVIIWIQIYIYNKHTVGSGRACGWRNNFQLTSRRSVNEFINILLTSFTKRRTKNADAEINY